MTRFSMITHCYALETKTGCLLAEGDELMIYLTRDLATHARKRRGYDDRSSARFCKIVKVAVTKVVT